MLLNKTVGEFKFLILFFPPSMVFVLFYVMLPISLDPFVFSYRIDSLSVLPSSFTSQDANKMLLLCPSVRSALKVGLIIFHNYSCYSFAINC